MEELNTIVRNTQGMNAHIRNMHQTEKNFQCDKCDFKHACLSGLNRHISYHHSNTEHVCHVCGYKSVKEHNLRLHIRMVHEKVKHPCPVEGCGKSKFNARKIIRIMSIDILLDSKHIKVLYNYNLQLFRASYHFFTYRSFYFH